MASKWILETPRLRLREMTEDDLPALGKMLRDEEVMYAYNGAFSEEETWNWLKRQQERYRRDGFGLWAVVLRETGEMIGQCGLTWQPWKEEKVLEVGYLFQKEHWHRGYAAEAARACAGYAFEALGAEKVCSIIRDSNLPSQKVALRNGMTRADSWVKRFRGEDMLHFRYIRAKGGKPG